MIVESKESRISKTILKKKKKLGRAFECAGVQTRPGVPTSCIRAPGSCFDSTPDSSFQQGHSLGSTVTAQVTGPCCPCRPGLGALLLASAQHRLLQHWRNNSVNGEHSSTSTPSSPLSPSPPPSLPAFQITFLKNVYKKKEGKREYLSYETFPSLILGIKQ